MRGGGLNRTGAPHDRRAVAADGRALADRPRRDGRAEGAIGMATLRDLILIHEAAEQRGIPPICKRGHPREQYERQYPRHGRRPIRVCLACQRDRDRGERQRDRDIRDWAAPLVDAQRKRDWEQFCATLDRRIAELRLFDGFDGRTERRPVLGPELFRIGRSEDRRAS
jgi:hypothetical protein